MREEVPYQGDWSGYLQLAGQKYQDCIHLTIQDDLSTSVAWQISGTTSAWGPYVLTADGSPTIRQTGSLLGPISLTRYRAGVDTVTVEGVISGDFDRKLGQVAGSWYAQPGSAFTASGTWGAVRTGGLKGAMRP